MADYLESFYPASVKVKVSSTDTTAGFLLSKLVAGTNITLTKNNPGGNETITIASTSSGGGTPGGSDTYIQFNDSGAFGGDQGFVYDSGNVGIGTASPSVRLEVSYPFTAAPSSFTASLSSPQTPIAAPTATASIIYGPFNVTSSSASENVGSSGYTCNGQTLDYGVYAYYGAKYVSAIPSAASVTDTVNDGVSTFSVGVSWSPVTLGDGTPVSGYIVTGPFGSVDVGPATSYTDDGTPQSASFSPFGGITSAGQIYTFDIFNYNNSPSYYSADGGSYSVTDTQNNGSPFWIQHAITGTMDSGFQINDYADQQTAQVFSNSFTQTGPLGLPLIAPQPQLIQSDGTALNRSYEAYGTDPLGDVYSSSFLTASVADPSDSQWYYIQLDAASGGNTAYRYLRNLNGAGYLTGLLTNVTNPFDDAYTPWTSDVTVTPSNSPAPASRFTNGNTTLLGAGAEGQVILDAEGLFSIPLMQWSSVGNIVGSMGYNPSSGRMLIAAGGGIDIHDNNTGQNMAHIGNATVFNEPQLSSFSYKVSTQNYQDALEISSDHVQINPGTLGHFGATPVAQPTAGGVTSGFVPHTSANPVFSQSTFTGNVGSSAYTLSDVVAALKGLGLIAM